MNPLIRIIEIKINQYKRLKNRIYNIIESINSVIECLQSPKEEIKNFFSIDDLPADNNSINKNYDKLVDISTELNNKVIPSIDYEIRKLKKKKSEIEGQLAMGDFYGLY